MSIGLRLLCFAAVASTVFSGGRATQNADDKPLQSYSKDVKPSEFNGGQPVRVKIGIYVSNLEFGATCGGMPTMIVHMYNRISWTDNRLSKLAPKAGYVLLDDSQRDRIWIPDIFIRNSIESSLKKEPTDQSLIRVSPGGKMWYVYSSKEVVTCSDKYLKEPGDEFTCSLLFESYKYTVGDMLIERSRLENAVDVDKDMVSFDYKLMNMSFKDCAQTYTAGRFPCHEFKLTFKQG